MAGTAPLGEKGAAKQPVPPGVPKSLRAPQRKLRSVKDKFGDEYIITEQLDAGGTGVVYKAHKANDEHALVAIKFYLPSAQNSLFQETTLQSLLLPIDEHVFETEFNFLRSTRHPGVQEIMSWGTLPDADRYFGPENILPPDRAIRFLVTKYIDGISLIRWIGLLSTSVKDGVLPREEARQALIRCLQELMDILVYIHEVRCYQHSDIRSANILVHKSSSRPILIDFAYAHCFDLEAFGNDGQMTQIRFFHDNCPPALRQDLIELMKRSGANKVPRADLKDLIFPSLDLYHLGLLLQDLINTDGIRYVITDFDINLITLLTRRLTAWGMVKSAKTSQYRDQFSKLSEGYWALVDRADSTAPTHPIKRVALPTYSLWITPIIERIVETHAFRRLQLLKQLSLLHWVYPGATQSRFEHSLSVYVTAGQLVRSLTRSPRFCVLFDSRSVPKLLVTALLHDINHFPFLHYFQEMKLEALDEVDLIDLFCEGKATGDNTSLYDLMQKAGLEPETFKDLLFRDYADVQDPVLQVIKSILDSGADIDKLTYVVEDSRSTGVPFGAGVDRWTLLHYADIGRFKESSATLDHPRHRYHLCYRREALSAVESLLMARYWNFKRIYWHHTNRAIEAMISHVIYKLFLIKKLSFEEYLRATISMDESSALDFLDRKYHQLFQKNSLIHSLGSHRDRLFKRLYSLKVRWEKNGRGGANSTLFYQIEALSLQQRMTFVEIVAHGLDKLFRSNLGAISITPEDVLLDVPGRPLDESVGTLHVCELALDGTPDEEIESPFIQQIRQQFTYLSKTIRFFISPTVREKLGKHYIEDSRASIEGVIRESLKELRKNKTNFVR